MKRLLVLGMIIGVASGDGGDQQGCTRKVVDLDREIVKAHGIKDPHRVNGLEVSLSKVETHRTDS